MFMILLLLWIILNNSFSLEVVGSGVVFSLVIALLLCKNCNVFNETRWHPEALFYALIYIAVFLWELLKANVDLAFRVLQPSLPINPGIVKAKTKLKSKMARLILANSITLTPGTFTIDVIGDELYIHCVNVNETDQEEFAAAIVRKFEKYLEKIYG